MSKFVAIATLALLGTVEAYRPWIPHYGGQWCYKVPQVPCPTPPAPATCCTLPASFGPYIVGVTCVPGTTLRPGESCTVACGVGCSAAGGSCTYTCNNGVLVAPSLQCAAPAPKPVPVPAPAANCCRGPHGEAMTPGFTYTVKPWGKCAGMCTAMFAWCAPGGGFQYCCGAACQRLRCPPPAPAPAPRPVYYMG